uniref:hypothetical protein n=2 Tax=Aliivibrio fischeri TaxID=668 RepID=UPI0038BD3D6A
MNNRVEFAYSLFFLDLSYKSPKCVNTFQDETDIYLKAVKRSMETMRRELYFGYSWHAYKAWNRGWANITPENRSLIKQFIEANSTYEDALAIVQKSLL